MSHIFVFSPGFGSLKSHSYPIMRSVSKENFKIRREVLTLKCNCNSLKMHGALWDNASHPSVLATSASLHSRRMDLCHALGCLYIVHLHDNGCFEV